METSKSISALSNYDHWQSIFPYFLSAKWIFSLISIVSGLKNMESKNPDLKTDFFESRRKWIF